MIHLHGCWSGTSPRTMQRAQSFMQKKNIAKIHADLSRMIEEKVLKEPEATPPWYIKHFD